MSMSILAPSTLATQLARRDTVLRLQVEYDRAAQEVSTGRHANSYEALGHDAARSLALEADLGRTDAFRTSNSLLRNRMETAAGLLSGIREAAQEVLTLAIPNRGEKSATASTLATSARTAIDNIAGMANISHNGQTLMAGVATDARALGDWTEAGPGGLSPSELMADLTGGALASGPDAAAKIAALDAAFAGAPYRDAFYGGAPAGGPRLGAAIDDGQTLEWGVQADDPAFRDLMQGLSMLAGVDAASIDDEDAYTAWMDRATESLSRGVSGLLDAEGTLGLNQERLEETISRQEDRRALYSRQISEIEGVDPYDAASRMTETHSRLQASYEVSARMLNLSFLDFMR